MFIPTDPVGAVVFRVVEELNLWAPFPPQDVLIARAIEAGAAPEVAADVVEQILHGESEGWRLACTREIVSATRGSDPFFELARALGFLAGYQAGTSEQWLARFGRGMRRRARVRALSRVCRVLAVVCAASAWWNALWLLAACGFLAASLSLRQLRLR
jgi:hypothetical protein